MKGRGELLAEKNRTLSSRVFRYDWMAGGLPPIDHKTVG
jgi:hypothetical protein